MSLANSSTIEVSQLGRCSRVSWMMKPPDSNTYRPETWLDPKEESRRFRTEGSVGSWWEGSEWIYRGGVFQITRNLQILAGVMTHNGSCLKKSISFKIYAWHAVGLQCWVNYICFIKQLSSSGNLPSLPTTDTCMSTLCIVNILCIDLL